MSRKALQQAGALMVVFSVLTATTAASDWVLQRDNTDEYKLLAVRTALSDIQCTMMAGNADAVRYEANSTACALLACRLGSSGCRKCRHASNSSLPLLWVKKPPSSCWRTFQHRVDGSVSFNRSWSEYVSGFGQGESLNFWMGLEQLHQISASGVWRVRWEFSDWNGTWYWAENAPFSIGAASDKYRASMGPLDASRSSVGQLTNTAWSPNNQQFSTVDSDNDIWSDSSCAQEKSAGWWFGYCTFINPNGVYKQPPSAFSGGVGIYYYLFNSGSVLTAEYSMSSIECMIGH